MRLTTAFAAGSGLFMALLASGQANAEPKIYPYPASANYCPSGLQPITISGVICCGAPNQQTTYAEVMDHPVQRRTVQRKYRSARAHCPVGVKGCSYD